MDRKEEIKIASIGYINGLVHSIILLDETVDPNLNLDCRAYYVDLLDSYQVEITHNEYWDDTTKCKFDIDPSNPKQVLFEIYNYIESLHKITFCDDSTRKADDEQTRGCDMYHASKEDF